MLVGLILSSCIVEELWFKVNVPCTHVISYTGEREATLFREDDPSSDDSSDGPEASDSAVESSSDEEGAESDSEGAGSSSDKNASDSSSDGEAKEDFNPFSEEPWLKPAKPRTKKRRLSPAARKKHKNFSIKPPPTSSRKGKTKTGFNSKSLKFEPGECVSATVLLSVLDIDGVLCMEYGCSKRAWLLVPKRSSMVLTSRRVTRTYVHV